MGRGTVLVIDDERDLVNLVRYNLESEGYEVLGALDGESGLNLALTRAPDLILLDRMMPGPDGVEVCRRLRREDRTAHVPVILLTAKAGEEDRVQGLDAGADDYVTKPFSVKELMARVRARLTNLPPRLAGTMLGAKTIQEAQARAEPLIREAMEELRRADDVPAEDDEDAAA
jgi:DNA-binding response OmpR family regulator